MAYRVESGAGSNTASVDPASGALRVSSYDQTGASGTVSFEEATSNGVPVVLKSFGPKLYTKPRVDGIGTQRSTPETTLFQDFPEVTTTNSAIWEASASGQGVTYSNSEMIFNSAATATANTAVMLRSYASFPRVPSSTLHLRIRAALLYTITGSVTVPPTQNLAEVGFADPASVIAVALGQGACFRFGPLGVLQIVVTGLGGETVQTVGVWNGTCIPKKGLLKKEIDHRIQYEWHIWVTGSTAVFQIVDCNTGELIYENAINPDSHWNTRAFRCIIRHRTTSVLDPHLIAGGISVTSVSVGVLDLKQSLPLSHIQSARHLTVETSPFLPGTTANLVNSSAPSTVTPINTNTGYTTWGGEFSLNPVSGSETDLSVFSASAPTGHRFYLTGVRINVYNTGMIGSLTASVFQWAIFVTTNLNLGTAQTRVPIGCFALSGSSPIGESTGLYWQPGTPIVIGPGRRLSLAFKQVIGSTVAFQFHRGIVAFEGYLL